MGEALGDWVGEVVVGTPVVDELVGKAEGENVVGDLVGNALGEFVEGL